MSVQFDEESPRGPAWEMGRLHARVDGIEARQNKHDELLIAMDGKLDGIKETLDLSMGGKQTLGALLRYLSIAAGLIGTVVTAVAAGFHFISIGISK